VFHECSNIREAVNVVDENLVLLVASYKDVATALSDYRCLEDVESTDDCAVVESVVLSRGGSGRVIVITAADRLLRADPPLRRESALAIGLFAPSLLLASAVDVGVGPEIRELVRRHDEGKLGAVVEEYLRRRSSAIVVILESRFLSGVEGAFSHAWKTMSATIDWDDYRTVDGLVSEAVISKRGGGQPSIQRTPAERAS
jgi:hypothetical protein